MPNKAGKDQEKLDHAPLWVWGVGLLGLLLILGSIGFMLYEAAAGDSSPPDVALQVENITSTRSGFLVEFRAVNEGGRTAEGLIVEGQLRTGTEIVEVSETTIEYVPSHSERAGGLFFTLDPRQYELELRAKGYETP